MRANIDGDLVIAKGSLVDGPDIPDEMAILPSARLRFVDGNFIDAAALSTFYVDELGNKHAISSPDWQQVVCAWDEQLMREGSVWRPRSSIDDLLGYVAGKRWSYEVAGVQVTVAGEQVQMSTDRGDDRIALLGEHSAIAGGLRSDGASFKFADGISRAVSNADMAAAVQAAFHHVQSAFDIERTVVAGITSTPPTIVSRAQIDAAFAAGAA